MVKQIIFIVILLATLGIFSYTLLRLRRIFKLTRSWHPINYPERLKRLFIIGIGQSRILRKPLVGFMHALVFWGFMVITIGSMEMVIDGITGLERSFQGLGGFYTLIIFTGDIFAWLILILIAAFIARRLWLAIPRFKGVEMKKRSKTDAYLALSIILLLMISLIGINISYNQATNGEFAYLFPLSGAFSFLIPVDSAYVLHEIFWWMHILLIFIFANMLPYSKHFHVFTSLPNVFLSRLEPLGKMDHMPEIEKEVRLMLDPSAVVESTDAAPARFGVKDATDLTWKSYLDSLTCTECGRCTAVCPANQTGKLLSPRKIVMDVRARMNEIVALPFHQAQEANSKSLLRDWITEEELWACTTCNACARECPVNINQPSIILSMRRYLVMEESAVPNSLATMLSNIENNGAPWQYPASERESWMNNIN